MKNVDKIDNVKSKSCRGWRQNVRCMDVSPWSKIISECLTRRMFLGGDLRFSTFWAEKNKQRTEHPINYPKALVKKEDLYNCNGPLHWNSANQSPPRAFWTLRNIILQPLAFFNAENLNFLWRKIAAKQYSQPKLTNSTYFTHQPAESRQFIIYCSRFIMLHLPGAIWAYEAFLPTFSKKTATKFQTLTNWDHTKEYLQEAVLPSDSGMILKPWSQQRDHWRDSCSNYPLIQLPLPAST